MGTEPPREIRGPVHRSNVSGNQLCLVVRNAPHASVGLRKAGSEEHLMFGMEDIEVQQRTIVVVEEMQPLEKRK